jgi:hypothetical protein
MGSSRFSRLIACVAAAAALAVASSHWCTSIVETAAYKVRSAARWLRDFVVDFAYSVVRAVGRVTQFLLPARHLASAAAQYLRRQLKRRPTITARFRMCPST